MKNYIGFRRWIVGGVIAAAATFSQQARADVPQVVTHQGRLFDAQGVPVVGAQDITFTIYDAEVAGNELWTETINVDLDEGYFSVRLGELTVLDEVVFDGSVRWLGITVGADPEMTPLAAIASVPYAMFAGDVTGAIHPKSVDIQGFGPVIDVNGQWVGDPTGLIGPAGPPGAKGADGAVGPVGPKGADGAVGPVGPVGPAGAQGAQGPVGPVGPAGPAGAQGAQGPAGPAGPAGPMGAMGAQGAQGVAGPAGPAGPAGAQGAQGLQGIQGVAGPAGPQGPSGIVATGKWSGAIGALAINQAFTFVGGTVQNLAITNTQRLTGASSASLLPATSGLLKVDLCFQDIAGGGAITNFAGGGATTHQVVAAVRGPIAATGTIVPALTSANVKVGMCISTTTGSLGGSDVSNGWVQITN